MVQAEGTALTGQRVGDGLQFHTCRVTLGQTSSRAVGLFFQPLRCGRPSYSCLGMVSFPPHSPARGPPRPLLVTHVGVDFELWVSGIFLSFSCKTCHHISAAPVALW